MQASRDWRTFAPFCILHHHVTQQPMGFPRMLCTVRAAQQLLEQHIPPLGVAIGIPSFRSEKLFSSSATCTCAPFPVLRCRTYANWWKMGKMHSAHDGDDSERRVEPARKAAETLLNELSRSSLNSNRSALHWNHHPRFSPTADRPKLEARPRCMAFAIRDHWTRMRGRGTV